MKRRAKAPARKRPAAAAGRASAFEGGLRELRASIANLRAVADALSAAGVKGRGRSAELLAALLAESERASAAVEDLAALARGAVDPVAGLALAPLSRFAASLARAAARELDLGIRVPGVLQGSFALSPDFEAALLAALGLLRRDYGVGEVELSARVHGDFVVIDLAFSTREPESSRLRSEHAAVLAAEADGAPSLGETARAAGGEAWLAIRRGEATFSLRILVPRAAPA